MKHQCFPLYGVSSFHSLKKNKIDMEVYLKNLKKRQNKWENICIRCGACCGAYEDPCKYLKKEASGKYSCEIYDQRLGLRKTVGGEKFRCVPIKEVMHNWWPGSHLCAYKNGIKRKLF
ncbi:MAG: hypothetical protein KAS99_05265 [Candidatus Omnitrophica bacterium]|nr:hypothetical protein [Candidatus Omnitrophota bacterium]